MKKNKITVITATARLGERGDAGREVILDNGKTVLGGSVILATGARARSLPDIAADGQQIVTYRDAMIPTTMPKTMIVIGSGAIGIEFASFYQDMGVEVTVLEAIDRILPAEDAEISALAEKAMTQRGMVIRTGVSLKSVKADKAGVTASIEEAGKTEQISAERLILAVGIIANTEELGIEDTAITLDRGHVVTDHNMRTGEADIYAIGDMTGAPWLAHKASHEGVVAAEIIAGHAEGHAIDPRNVPGCTYCRPQIASIGYTEQAARDAGHDIKVGRFPFLANGKAIAMGDDDGVIKTIFDAKTGALLGAHMIGPEVTELIHGYAIARMLETTEAELMQTIFPHPTLSEAMHESVLDAYDKALHF
jgi:dihydrolipoamide dehydrogenase